MPTNSNENSEVNRYKLVREIAMSVWIAFHGGRPHASLPQRSDRADSAGDLLRTCTQNATRSEPPEETLLSRAGTRRMAEWVAWKLRTHQHTVSLVVFFASGIEQSEAIAALASQLAPLGRDKVWHINENHRLRGKHS